MSNFGIFAQNLKVFNGPLDFKDRAPRHYVCAHTKAVVLYIGGHGGKFPDCIHSKDDGQHYFTVGFPF